MKKKRRSKRVVPEVHETRVAEAVTVAWMLAVVSTLMAEAVIIAARWYLSLHPELVLLQAFAELIFFAALVGGLLSLGLTPLVLKVRQTPPPRGIIVLAVVVGSAPLVVLLARVLA